MLTLNQTIEILKNFSFKHKALGKNQSEKTFYFGDSWEVAASNGIEYPFMFATLLPTKPDKSGMITRKFQIDISDKVNLDESNENHVLSDTESICFDFINYIEQIQDAGDVLIKLGEVSELTDYTEGRDDMVSGWFFTIEIICHQSGTSCNLPIFDGNIFDGNYIYVGGSQNSGCLPVTIKDQNGNIVKTVQPGGIYTVEVLTQVVDTVTSNTATIIDPIV